MTANDPAEGQPYAFDRSEAGESGQRVLRAGRVIAAVRSEQRRQEAAIATDESAQDAGGRAHDEPPAARTAAAT